MTTPTAGQRSSTSPVGRPSIARARLEKFAPEGLDAGALKLPEQVTHADLDAAITRIAGDQSAFSDPAALTDYLKSQQALLTEGAPVASAPAEDDQVISDVVPRRKKPALSPELAAVPELNRSLYAKAGLTEPQMVRAHQLGLKPRELMVLLATPRKPTDFNFMHQAPAPNTVGELLAALEAGVPVDVLLAYHQIWARAADVPEVHAQGITAEELKPYLDDNDARVSAMYLRAGMTKNEAYEASCSQQPPEAAIKAHQLGMNLHAYAWTVRGGHMTPEQAFELWQNYDHGLFVDGYMDSFTNKYTFEECKQLADSGVVDFSRDPRKLIEYFNTFREAKLTVAETIAVIGAGGSANGVSEAREQGLSLDQYLSLARCGAPEDAPLLVGDDKWSFDEVVRAFEQIAAREIKVPVEKSGPYQGVAHALDNFAELGLSVDVTLALIEARVGSDRLRTSYMRRGLTPAEAAQVVLTGG